MNPELRAIAQAVCKQLYGTDQDCNQVTEIYNWLDNGDGIYTMSDVDDLVSQWNEWMGK
jgi:hypothetical protein